MANHSLIVSGGENQFTVDPDEYSRQPERQAFTHVMLDGDRHETLRSISQRMRFKWNHVEEAQYEALRALLYQHVLLYLNDGNVPPLIETDKTYTNSSFNFVGIENGSSTHIAYYDTKTSLPDIEGDLEDDEYSTAHYQAIDVDDDNCVTITPELLNEYGYQKFLILSDVAQADVQHLRIRIKLSASDTHSTDLDGAIMYGWQNNSSWVELARTSNSDTQYLTFSTFDSAIAQSLVDPSDSYIRIVIQSMGTEQNGIGGIYADLDDGTYFSAGNVLNGGTDDICLSILFRPISAGVHTLISTQAADGAAGYTLKINKVGSDPAFMLFQMSDGVDQFEIWGATDPDTGATEDFTRVDVRIDRSSLANCKIYLNGSDDTDDSDDAAALAAVGDIDSAGAFAVGAYNDGSEYCDTEISDVRVYIAASAMWTLAQMIYHYNAPLDYTAAGGSYTSHWGFNDRTAAANGDSDGMITDGSGSGSHLDAVGGTTTNYGLHSRSTPAEIILSIYYVEVEINEALSLIITLGHTPVLSSGDVTWVKNLDTPATLGRNDYAIDTSAKTITVEQPSAHLDGDSQFFYQTDASFPESGITGDMTIEAWVQVDDFDAHMTIVSKWDDGNSKRSYLFGILSTEELYFAISSDGSDGADRASTNLSMTPGVWYHVAVIYDASESSSTFYVDGVALTDDGDTLLSAIADLTANFEIGNISSQGDWLLDGKIAHVAIFDDIRTPAELLTSAQRPEINLSAEGNIIGQWHFTEDGDATVIDNTQGDAGRDLIPYDGGDVTYANCGRGLPGTATPGDVIEVKYGRSFEGRILSLKERWHSGSPGSDRIRELVMLFETLATETVGS